MIEVWADVRCPWCWIGLRRLRAAAAEVPGTVVRHRSFLLEPGGPATRRPVAEVAVTEWGMTAEQWRATSERIRTEGARDGLEINIDTARTCDTGPVHGLLKLAHARGINDETAWDAAFDTHLRRNRDLTDPAVLRDLATELGLGDDALTAAAGFDADVRADHDAAVQLGVRSVPSVVHGDRVLAGSRSRSELVDFLTVTGAQR